MHGNVRGSLVSILLLLAALISPPSSRAQSSEPDERILIHLEALYNAFVYDSTGYDDGWWIDMVPADCTVNDLGRISLALSEQEVGLTGILMDFKPRGALADSIIGFLNRPRATIYYQGSSISMGKTSANDLTDILDRFEFCFIPQISDDGELTVQFYPDWSALLIPAVEWPRPVLAGLVYHEGGHAFLSQHTLLSIDEQDAQLQSLEAELLNTASDGAAFKLVDSIMSRGTPDIQLITVEDVRSFSRLIKADSGGPIVKGAVFNQFIRLMGVRVNSLAQAFQP